MGQCGRIQNLWMLIAGVDKWTAPSWILESIVKYEMNHGKHFHRASPPPLAAISREARKALVGPLVTINVNSQSRPQARGKRCLNGRYNATPSARSSVRGRTLGLSDKQPKLEKNVNESNDR